MPPFLDADGLFNGDRIRRCSNLAQLHFPRLLLAADAYGRLELNYAKLLRAYATFKPIPSEIELQAFVQEYYQNYLLFPYIVDGQMWAQWDCKPEFLPRYKTAADRRSPRPPEAEYLTWKSRYRSEYKSFPKFCGNISGTLPENFAQSSVVLSCVEERSEEKHTNLVRVSQPKASDLDASPSSRWEEFWGKYPRKQRRDFAAREFFSYVTVTTEAKAFACLDRYLRSAEVARGVVMNPDKWLREQHVEGWAGDWPQHSAPSAEGNLKTAIVRNLKDFGRI